MSSGTRRVKLIGKVPLSRHPNNISAIEAWQAALFVAIARAPGAVDVIDTVAMKNIPRRASVGAGHNTYVSPDGKIWWQGRCSGKSFM